MTLRRRETSEEYSQWNKRLLEYALTQSANDDGRFFLTVRQMLEDITSVPDAEHRFRTAVSEEYAITLGHEPDAVYWFNRQTDVGGRPLSVALLGLSVLAAEQMQDNNYYERLAALLRQPQQGSGVRGFVGVSFEAAWRTLNMYLHKTHGRYVEEPEHDGHRFVRWPRMHALLRAMDTAKLPYFFAWAQLSPKRSVASRFVFHLFDVWLKSSDCDLTPLGRRACANEVSRPGILRQVWRMFEQWDGTLPIDGGSNGSGRCDRIASADALLVADVQAQRARILLRTRRPIDFPARIAMPDLSLTAASDGYYQDVRLPSSWGEKLEEGLLRSVGVPESRMRFRLKGATAFALLDGNEDGVYEAATALRLMVRCGVLCLSALAEKVENYLRAISHDVPLRAQITSGLPGWTLFYGFKPQRVTMPPYGLELLEADSALFIRPVGGLRIGRSQEWMHGAPPQRLEVMGRNQPKEVIINGCRHQTSEPLAPKLSEPGFYAIVADKERYSLRIVEPTLNGVLQAPSNRSLFRDNDDTEFSSVEIDEDRAPPAQRTATTLAGDALPAGLQLLGPTFLVAPSTSPMYAANPTPALGVQWAIGLVEGRRSVIAFHSHPLPPTLSRRLSPSWTNAILRAAPYRLGLLLTQQDTGNISDISRQAVTASWRAYIAAAQRVRKRGAARSRLHEEDAS